MTDEEKELEAHNLQIDNAMELFFKTYPKGDIHWAACECGCMDSEFKISDRDSIYFRGDLPVVFIAGRWKADRSEVEFGEEREDPNQAIQDLINLLVSVE